MGATVRLLGPLGHRLRPRLHGIPLGRGEIQIGPLTVRCRLGDIADAEVDGIVNSANDEMTMKTGVGGSLRAKGGQIVEDEELNRYLNTAIYQDRFVSKVFAMLDDLGLADETVVAVVGDHGEGFGEHGLRQHDNTIYDEGVQVPLIIYDPADPVGRVVDTL